VLARALDASFPAVVHRHITALTVARLWANACYRFAPPFLATIARGFDVGLAELGIALTISELLGLIAPLIGRGVDRMDRRAAMTAGLAGVAGATAIAAAAPTLWVFTIGVLLLGPAKIVFDVGLASWVTDHVPYARRGRVIGITETSWALGLLIGVTSMGLLTSATSWRWGYALGALATAVMAAVIGLRMDRDEVHDRRGPVQETGSRIPRSAWLVVATMFGLTAASQCVFVTFGAWLEDDYGFTGAGLAGVGFAIGAVELVSSTLSAGRTDSWGKERSVVLGCALMVPSGLLLLGAQSMLIPGLVLLGLFLMGFEFAIVSALPIVANIVPGAPGRGLGLGMGGATLGRAAMSVTATALYEWGGFGAAAVLAGVWALVSITTITIYARAL
jgi:MFS transporter, DHA1 family, inner membrane transport protein